MSGSPHYADQAPLYAAEQLRPVPWTEEEARAQATAVRAMRRPAEHGS